MNNAEALIDILDTTGQIAANKPRKDVIKGIDVYHAVYAVIVTPDNNVAISRIAQRQDLPNLHAGSYGCTAATIRRSGETAQDAIKRAAKNELFLEISPELFYEGMQDVDNTKRMVGLYIVRASVPTNFNKQDIEEIVTFTKEDFTEKLASSPEQFTPLLKLFWEKYSNKYMGTPS